MKKALEAAYVTIIIVGGFVWLYLAHKAYGDNKAVAFGLLGAMLHFGGAFQLLLKK